MPQVGLTPTILVFEQVKTVHALDRSATVIGLVCIGIIKLVQLNSLQSGGHYTVCTTCFKMLKFCILPKKCICVSCGSQNKRRFFSPKQH
jgi:rRNA maturation endonuclease Nob1